MGWVLDIEDVKGMSPGEYLQKKVIEPLGLSIQTLASDINVPANRLYQILRNERDLTTDTALRLGKYFGTGPEMWLYLQMNYDIKEYLPVWVDESRHIHSFSSSSHS